MQEELDWWLEHGETEELLLHMPDNSVDALVTDPPAGIGFMGREWDKNKGGRDQWIAWLRGVLEECRRVMKPGAYGWVWALPRTSHWTATACEDAGFAVRDVLDEAFSMRSLIQPFMESLSEDQAKLLSRILEADQPSRLSYLFGTGFPKSRALLKPAVESWILVKAPGELRELRIDESRISFALNDTDTWAKGEPGTRQGGFVDVGAEKGASAPNGKKHELGRWPANFAIIHDDECIQVGTRKVKTSDPRRADGTVHGGLGEGTGRYGGGTRPEGIEGHGYGDAEGHEVVEAWQCVEGCPVAMLDDQSRHLHGAGTARKAKRECGAKGLFGLAGDGHRLGDFGTASRFFYVAKPSASERSAGLPDGTRNIHPTVKSIKLMEHLVSLIAAPGDLVLDPFAGSGTTGIAALKQRCRFVGIEKEAEYVQIARQRLAHAAALAKTFPHKIGRRTTTAENSKQGRLL